MEIQEDAMKRKLPTLTKHHMMPRTWKGSSEFWNIMTCTTSEHRAWHTLFNSQSPHEAILEILRFWTPQELRQETLNAVIAEEFGPQAILKLTL